MFFYNDFKFKKGPITYSCEGNKIRVVEDLVFKEKLNETRKKLNKIVSKYIKQNSGDNHLNKSPEEFK